MSTPGQGQFPTIRLRRSRRTAALRRLVAETTLSSDDLIYPVFVLEGENTTEPVPSMPGIERKTVDGLLPLASTTLSGNISVAAAGITAISLDTLPRTLSRAQSMDALSSQANVGGYKAVVMAADAYGRYFPLLMTAAGTVPPATRII